MKVAVGGTFAYLHKGHLALLKKAFAIGDVVYIGLTTDEYVLKNKSIKIKSYKERREELDAAAKTFGKKYKIVPLNDRYGPTITDDIDAIVISREGYSAAKKINDIRKQRGMPPLEIFVVDYVLAEDNKPVSSSRIFNKEIDEEGNMIH